jgi:hypothetical protein
MKLVQEKYRNERKFIVSDSTVKRGFDFENSEAFLTDATQEQYNEYLELAMKEEIFFREWLENQGIKYTYIPNTYISIEEMKVLISNYAYFYNDSDEFIKSSEALECQECNFIEWWNGHRLEQVEVTDEVIELECIDKQLEEREENKALFGQYDLYKDKEDNYYLHWKSYYQGNLGSVEEITLEGIEERFDYDINRLGFYHN